MADDNNTDFQKLVDLMAENNRATSEIERDGRNTRRHLLEMKNMQTVALDTSKSMATVFDNFFEAMDANALSNAEKESERASIFEDMRDTLAGGIDVNTSSGNDVSSKDGKGLMSKLGGMMGGAAMAAGALLAGVGIGAAGLTYAMGKIEELDTDKIKENVDDLLSMAESDRMTVANVAGVAATMTALGVGLAAFSVGKGTAGVADAVTKFSGENFAEDIKREVETLLSIDTGAKGDVSGFVGTMTALSAGLVAFAIGKGSAGAADALTKFTAGDNFAEDIKREVDTLLTIGDSANLDRTLAATGSLTALGAGLTAFGAGKGVNALADIGSSVIGFFTGSKSPVEQAIEVGEKADTIHAGADAFSAFADVFERMSTMGDISIDMDDAIEDMVEYTKTLEKILQGGKLTIGKNFTTDGLANLTGDVDKAVANINRVRGALQLEQNDSAVVQGASNDQGSKVVNLSAENIELRFPENSSTGQSNNVAVADNRSTASSVTTNVNMSPQNRTSATIAGPYG